MTARARRERGTAAIEMVLVLGFGMVLLAGLVLFGRLSMHVIAMEKAIGNTTRIVAALPHYRLTVDGAYQQLPALAATLIRAETSSAGIDIQPTVASIGVQCDDVNCGFGLDPATISVSSTLSFTDTVFHNGYTRPFLPPAGSLAIVVKYSQLCEPIALTPP